MSLTATVPPRPDPPRPDHSSAIARPIPAPAPVTNAVLPARSPIADVPFRCTSPLREVGPTIHPSGQLSLSEAYKMSVNPPPVHVKSDPNVRIYRAADFQVIDPEKVKPTPTYAGDVFS